MHAAKILPISRIPADQLDVALDLVYDRRRYDDTGAVTYDPLQAVLYGNISASLVVEGSGPVYALDALPGLAEARLEAQRQAVRKL